MKLLATLVSISLAVLSQGVQATPRYVNSNGREVSGPKHSLLGFLGSSAKCRDGAHSYSRHHSGTCSGHGGVR